jgi:hypothetical protein
MNPESEKENQNTHKPSSWKLVSEKSQRKFYEDRNAFGDLSSAKLNQN